jgi:HD-GYP domain-containing protein (c-di-GMP phosphodiesterase class II)
MGGSSSRPFLRFAIFSAVIVGLVALGATFASLRMIGQREENLAAQSARNLIADPVTEMLGGPTTGGVSADMATELDAVTQPLVNGGQLISLRILDENGAAQYTAGTPPSLQAPPLTQFGAPSHQRVRTTNGAAFVTYERAGDRIIEIAQTSGSIDKAIQAAQLEAIFAVIMFCGAGWLLFQGAFWFGIHNFKDDHGRLAYLYDTGQQLRSSLDLHDVLSQLATDGTGLAHAHYGLVALLDDDTQDVVLKATYDHSNGSVALHQRPLDEWFMRRCVATATTVVTSSGAAGYKQFFGPNAAIEHDASLLCVPMSLGNKVVGAIAVIRTEGGFPPNEVQLVEELAAQAVTAVEQAILFQKVRSDANQLEHGYDTTLKALMAALDAKDEVTEGHCERVAKLTVELAGRMGMAKAQIVHVERGALLHDVGKIGVPDAILKKPKSLNEQEWEAMRKHPLLAGLMVSKIGFLEPALPILLYHHEHVDGSGYPFGLVGDNIPLEARIFSAIDAYDAMTSDRPYRPAMSHEQAMEELRAHSGTQFDPEVVSLFHALMMERPELRQHSGTHVLHSHDHEEGPDLRPTESAA